jgi:3-dehydroquinate dehydratase/shikimate dehydrogenase
MPIRKEDINPQATIMDIHTKPKWTDLLIEAAKLGCKIVHGYKMYIEQAIGQHKVWFEKNSEIRVLLEKTIDLEFTRTNGR